MTDTREEGVELGCGTLIFGESLLSVLFSFCFLCLHAQLGEFKRDMQSHLCFSSSFLLLVDV